MIVNTVKSDIILRHWNKKKERKKERKIR